MGRGGWLKKVPRGWLASELVCALGMGMPITVCDMSLANDVVLLMPLSTVAWWPLFFFWLSATIGLAVAGVHGRVVWMEGSG